MFGISIQDIVTEAVEQYFEKPKPENLLINVCNLSD